jgi:hypothetical protein
MLSRRIFDVDQRCHSDERPFTKSKAATALSPTPPLDEVTLVLAAQRRSDMKANGWAIPSACIPQHVKTEQVRDVVVQYLAAHPEIRHEAAGGHALLALQAAFPCKQ